MPGKSAETESEKFRACVMNFLCFKLRCAFILIKKNGRARKRAEVFF